MIERPKDISEGSGQKDLLVEAQAALQALELDQAEKLCIQSLSIGRTAPAMLLLAVVYVNAGRYQTALQVLNDLIRLDPTSVEAWDWMATLLIRVGQTGDAIRAATRSLELSPNSASVHNTIGQCYLVQGRWADASRSFENAIRLDPINAMFHYHRGIAMREMGREQETIASFERAIHIAPDSPIAYAELGTYLQDIGKNVLALDTFKRAASAAPQPTTFIHYARALIGANQFEEAISWLRKALELQPNNFMALDMLGIRLQDAGQFDEAIACYERSLSANPSGVWPYYGIGRCRKILPEDQPMIEHIETMLLGNQTDDHRRYLHYALGKAYDDLGNYEEAMAHFDEANRLSKTLRDAQHIPVHKIPLDGKNGLFQTFNKNLYARESKLGTDSNLPILIVGMIRSGTTLVEQILSSHPDVVAGGEQKFWIESAANQVLQGVLHGTIRRNKATELADEYRRLLRSLGPKAKRVTDKMPINYPMLGLVHLLFPNARIIHCRRNPVDTCLSIYTTYFEGGPDFAFDKNSIVAAYREYLRIMDHWRSVLPQDRLMEIDYEDLVSDREKVTREMVEFVGLDWNDACLHPEANNRTVHTPSGWQVRQPVYRTSVERWRRYEPWIGAFAELLPPSK